MINAASGSFEALSVFKKKKKTPTTLTRREKPVRESKVTTAEARSKSTRVRKPNKRLRGDDWIN
jgi:hypothetical protein